MNNMLDNGKIKKTPDRSRVLKYLNKIKCAVKSTKRR